MKILPGVPQPLRSNIILFYWDIIVWGLYMGTTTVFLPVYAARTGATTTQIGLITAAPALVALLTSLPLGVWVNRFNLQRVVVITGGIARGLLLGFVFLPLLLPANQQIWGILAVVMMMTFSNTIIIMCFGPFFLSVFPRDWRATVTGVRIALMSVFAFVVTLASGQLLTRLPFPFGYQVIFFIGFTGAFSTVFFLTRVKVHTPAEVSTGAQAPSLRRLLPETGKEGRHYLLVVGLLFFVNLTTFMTAPLLPQYYVSTLRLSDDIISVGVALTSILVFLLSLGFPRLSARLGNQKATALGIGLLSLQNLALAGARGAGLFITAAVAAGIANGVLSAAAFNWHLDSVPRRDQSVWVAWNSTLTNLAALVGSLLGPVVAGITGTAGAFIFLAGLRLLIGGAIFRWGKTPINPGNP